MQRLNSGPGDIEMTLHTALARATSCSGSCLTTALYGARRQPQAGRESHTYRTRGFKNLQIQIQEG